MQELLRNLPPGAVALDLGCARGSFDSEGAQHTVVRFDLERESPAPPNFVQGDAAKLPFSSACFDVAIFNHSLEHVENLASSLEEISRGLKSNSALYVAVPDATTIADKLYRWLARGGGHLNQFCSADELALKIERATGLKRKATRTRCTSLSFLNRRNHRSRAPRRLLLLGGGTHISLLLLTGSFRLLDRFLDTRLSLYGWAFYFGNIETSDVDCTTWSNVCVRCGTTAYRSESRASASVRIPDKA